MPRKTFFWLFLPLAWLSFAVVAETSERSQYVNLGQANCSTPKESDLLAYQAKDLGVVQCLDEKLGSGMPFRIYLVSSSERSWLDIYLGGTLWSSEDEVVYQQENQFGDFPNVATSPAELMRDGKGKPLGLIFRVTAQSQGISGKADLTRLVVLGFQNTSLCFLGLSQSNLDARELITKHQCLRPLKRQ